MKPEVIALAEEIFDATLPVHGVKSSVRPFAHWRPETQSYFSQLAEKVLDRGSRPEQDHPDLR